MGRAVRAFFAFVFVLVWVLSPGVVGRAQAQSLEDAKRAGWVGERPDGYLGLVKPNAPEDIKKLVQSINAKRREEYIRIAKKNGTDPKVVQVIVGRKLIERAQPGEYIMDASGEWIRK